jgi:hypothetical protein
MAVVPVVATTVAFVFDELQIDYPGGKPVVVTERRHNMRG